jgi:hypothetical protein
MYETFTTELGYESYIVRNTAEPQVVFDDGCQWGLWKWGA